MGDWVIGLDLGQASDYSALTAVERHVDAPEPRYECRQLRRWPLGTPYPTVVAEVLAVLGGGALARAPLVVDGTGVGRAVVDMFAPLKDRCKAVLITAGATATQDAGWWHVPKRDLVGTVAVLLQSGRLKIAAQLPEAAQLRHELVSFRLKFTPNGTDTYSAWRDNDHDDIVLALALALWWGETHPPLALVAPSGGWQASTWLRR